MSLKHQLVVWAVAASALGVGTNAHAVPIFVGQFNVYDGPVWTSNPAVMSAREVAAMLFGGAPTDYMISIVNDVNNITRTAHVDGWGDTTYLQGGNAASEDFKLTTHADGLGYNNFPSFSAWVCDHANCVDYGFSETTGDSNLNYTNYVFTESAPIPEPATLGLLGLGLSGLAIRRRKAA